MSDGVRTRNADESQRLSTQRAQRTQSFRNESRPFRRLRGIASVERIDFLRESEETRGGSYPPQCKKDTTRSERYPRRFSCCDSSTRCALQWRRVRNRAAEGGAGAQVRREQRQRGFPGLAETRREAQAASQAPAAGGLSWPDPEGDVYSFRRTNPEIRRGHVRQTRSRDDRHRRRGLCVYPCPSNVRCRDPRRDPCRACLYLQKPYFLES